MPTLPSALDACRVDLFASEDELRQKYPAPLAERIMRLRDMYNQWLCNPGWTDKQLVDEMLRRFPVKKSAAYADVGVIHQLVPLVAQKSRAYHRAKANAMLLESYEKAKEKGDVKTMTSAAAAYAKYNAIDREDEVAAEIPPAQPFSLSCDPTVLGVKPIPDIYNYIDRLTKELTRDNRDIEDVDFEEPDLEEKHLFPTKEEEDGNSRPQCPPSLF